MQALDLSEHAALSNLGQGERRQLIRLLNQLVNEGVGITDAVVSELADSINVRGEMGALAVFDWNATVLATKAAASPANTQAAIVAALTANGAVSAGLSNMVFRLASNEALLNCKMKARDAVPWAFHLSAPAAAQIGVGAYTRCLSRLLDVSVSLSVRANTQVVFSVYAWCYFLFICSFWRPRGPCLGHRVAYQQRCSHHV